jgi:hypothetical protein
MTTEMSSTSYSAGSLQALKELLQHHQALLWVDPTTNSLAVKHITHPLEEEERREPVEA